MKFDREFEIETEQGRLPYYGTVEGNSRVVFIKAGAGGDHRGFEDKYIRMARLLNSLSGCTVVCASNPPPTDFLRRDLPFLEWYLKGREITPTAMHYIGASAGATVGLVEATARLSFESILLINMPLMINYHKIKAAIAALPESTRVTFVFGELDPSQKYVPFLRSAIGERHSVIEYRGADHCFTGMVEEFVELAARLFV